MIFVVAEIGVNWDGDLDLVTEMIRNSKKMGCDAVKFQSFEEKQAIGHPEAKRLMKSSISDKNIDKIDQIAKNEDIEWFATPMYLDAINLLDPYVKRFKIRDLDGINLAHNKYNDLINAILDCKKQIFVSSHDSPINSNEYNNSNIDWLYCIPKYPCQLNDLNFVNIKEFDGYSNHCPKIIAPLMASILGAKIIECHITSDKSKDFVDNNVSFDYNEMEYLVKQIRDVEKVNSESK